LHRFFRHFHRFRRVLLLVSLNRLQFGLFPIRAVFRLRVPIFDGSVWPNTINDPKRIMAQHEQLCGGLEPLGPDFRVPGRVRPFQ